MKNRIKILSILFFTSLICFGQNQEEKVLYIVDSIPIIEEPKEGFGILSQDEIDKIEVLTEKKSIEAKGYKDLDKIIYVFTKEYSQRPDSIKSIPTTLKMERKNGKWFLNNDSKPYSGKFIDYYLNGKKQGEGNLLNGTLIGTRRLYHINGNISDLVEYQNGIPNGIEKRFYSNGALMQQGEFKNGKEIGIWEMFHPNQQLKQRTFFNENGKMDGESISYYSTGEIKGKSVYKNGEYQKDKINDKLFELYNQSQELYQQQNYKGAMKKLDKALEIEPNWADGYFSRGTMKLNDFQFDNAKEDFDKTLNIEPYFTNAYGNRAFSIIRKFEFSNSRNISKTKDIQIIASKEAEIPNSELIKICSDLKKAIELGDNNHMILEALEKYCAE